jgi:pimeloyl-[acyl-carrier protein] methyl ester esterase
MYVKVYGSGDRQYMCFHGWGGDHREFVPLARRAPSRVRLHCVDLPGYGQSARPAKWDMKAITQEALVYLDEKEIPSATMIGFCSGIGPALTMGAMAPDRVERIVMIDPFAFLPWYFKIFLWGAVGRISYASAFQSPIGRKITDAILKRLQTSDADFTNAFTELDHDVTLRYLQILHRIDIQTEYAGLQVRIDVLYGEHTFVAVRRSVQIFKNLLPQIKTHELADVGHLPMIKGARQLAAAIFEKPATESSIPGTVRAYIQSV